MTQEYFTETEHNVYVPATDEQIAAVERLVFLNRLKAGWKEDCPHTVFFDTPSYMYTERRCLACKLVIELI